MESPRRTSAPVEGENYLPDLGICRQKSKSGTGSILNSSTIVNDIKDGKVDEDYASFLQDCLGDSESLFMKEDEDDPTYKMFLENLKECGNAYMLGVSMENGVSFPIIYEVEDDPPDKLQKKILRSLDSLIREMRSLCLENEMQSAKENSVYLTTKRKRLDVNDEPNSGHRNSGLSKTNFLRRSPRISQNASLLQSQDTPSTALVRERQESSVSNKESNSSLKNPSSRKKNTTRHNSRIVQNSSDAKKKQPGFTLDSKVDMADELYGCFIAGLTMDGDFVYYESPGGKQVYYEEDDQQKSANDDDQPQRTPTCPPRQQTVPRKLPTPTPRAQTDKDDSNILNTPKKVVNNSKAGRRDHSQFWKEVKKDLRRPFEQKEYEDLLECVNARKPIEAHKETRSGGYATKRLSQLGNSYLDSYPDLKQELEKAKSDPFKVLNLLRGFFIYLKKIPLGVPKPWKDESCKTIMPKTRCA